MMEGLELRATMRTMGTLMPTITGIKARVVDHLNRPCFCRPIATLRLRAVNAMAAPKSRLMRSAPHVREDSQPPDFLIASGKGKPGAFIQRPGYIQYTYLTYEARPLRYLGFMKLQELMAL